MPPVPIERIDRLNTITDNTRKAGHRMKYVSTRGMSPVIGFADAVTGGTARDKGLFMCEEIPRISMSEITDLKGRPYPLVVSRIVSKFVAAHEYDRTRLLGFANEAYAPHKWTSKLITPVHTLAPLKHVLELFHGPTLAFKDAAMQIVAPLMSDIYQKRKQRAAIAVATSGDTGSAAIEAFQDLPDIDLFVLFPEFGTSKFQRAQMSTSLATNIHPIAINATFDVLQKIVKTNLLTSPFKDLHDMTTVNSIGFGRIVTQVPYFFHAWNQVATHPYEIVMFVIPSGNMGDFFAGLLAQQMGLPIRLVLATNSNNVLARFVNSGVYQKAEQVDPTRSPSMDIQVGSNFERFLYVLVGGNAALVRTLMEEFETTGRFDISDTPYFERLKKMDILAGWASEEECLAAMCEVHREYGYVLDPHSAIGYAVGKKLALQGRVIYLATASPLKFEDAVREAGITEVLFRPARFVGIEDRPETRLAKLPPDAALIQAYISGILAQKKAA